MNRRYGSAAFLGALLLSGSAFAQGRSLENPGPCKAYDSPAVQEHINKALALSTPDVASPSLIPNLYIITRMNAFCQPKSVADYKINNALAKPVKMFDQLWYIGDYFVGVLVLKTSAGLIMWDAMWTEDQAEKIIEPGMRSLGLNPADVKHIIVTHGHSDHWGGTKRFQDKYGTQVHMGPEDWEVTVRSPAGPGKQTPPKRDKDVVDGEKLTLGDTTVTLYISPGHTAQAVSAIFPVTDNGTKHVASVFGGTGIPPFLADDAAKPSKYASVQHYVASVRRLEELGIAAGADVGISTHPIFDGTLDKAQVVANRKGPGPNPWVLGKENLRKYMEIHAETALAVQSMVAAAAAANKK